MQSVTVEAVLKPDGTLEFSAPLDLPAGPVQVTVVPLGTLPADDPFWKRMQALWAGQRAREHVARTAQEIEAQRCAAGDEWDERMRRIEKIQEEAARLRRGSAG